MRHLVNIAMLAAVLAALVSGCRPTTEPEGTTQPPVFLFTPGDSQLQVTPETHVDFQVRTEPEGPTETRWLVDGQEQATGPRFRYFATHLGSQVVQVESRQSDRQSAFQWDVEVQLAPGEGPGFLPSASYLELPLTGEQLFEVVVPGQLELSYLWSLNGVAVGDSGSYTYLAAAEGLDTLRVDVGGLAEPLENQWLVMTGGLWDNVHYSPVQAQQHLVETQGLSFLVMGTASGTDIGWFRNGEAVAHGDRYEYLAGSSPVDSVRVVMSKEGESREHAWTVTVDPLGTYPPAATGIRDLVYGELAGQVRITWAGASIGVFPVADYTVLFSHEGPINAENQAQALCAGPAPHLGAGVIHSMTLGPEHGLELGGDIWLAVQTRDTAGQISQVLYNYSFSSVATWAVSGRVTDIQGNPLAGVQIRDTRTGLQVLTDDTGQYLVGPFSPGVNTRVQVGIVQSYHSDWAWYGCTSDTLDVDSAMPLDVVLPEKLRSDENCDDYGSDFLTYFRYMTRTSRASALRPNQRLYHWDSYPVRVYVPEGDSWYGLDMQAEARWAMALWNRQLGGEPIFQETGNPTEAQLVWDFTAGLSNSNGQVALLEPSDQAYGLGDVIPQLMRVWIDPELEEQQRVRETMLHELGHTLGLYRHSLCNSAGYLMYITAAGALNQGEENAIHQDELRAVRAIRGLPQGVDMGGYEGANY